MAELECLVRRMFITILPRIDRFVLQHLDELIKTRSQKGAENRTYPVYLLPSVTVHLEFGAHGFYPMVFVERV